MASGQVEPSEVAGFALCLARLGEAEKAERALTEFKKISRNEAGGSQDADQAIEEDTRRETEPY